jgi:hypothetical protein
MQLSNEPQYPSAPVLSQQAQLVQQPDNGTGLWALILGILGLVFFGVLTGIPAIFLGISGRRKAAAGKATNGGQALAGIVLGILSIALTVLALALILALMGAASVNT